MRWNVHQLGAPPRLLAVLVSALCLLALEGCGSGRGPAPKLKRDDPAFYDYTTASVSSLAEFQQLAAVPGGVDDRPAVAGAKFVITNFSDPALRKIRFLDGRYFQFHDEWAWFRLLNGQSVSGMDPMERHAFASPDDARHWAAAHEDDLPDGLEITEGRLYARHFYDVSLSETTATLQTLAVDSKAARCTELARTSSFSSRRNAPSCRALVCNAPVTVPLGRAATCAAIATKRSTRRRSPSSD